MTFQGELMTCIVCSRQQRSDPDTGSNWRALTFDDVTFYACPDEFPPNDAGAEAFKIAYTKVFRYCLAAYNICPSSFAIHNSEAPNDPP